ncbi:GNAT family N-acetyltransferase [Conexibacter sp. JD483]|uniref:GNAT family N-acetyltransferase n=1 Tax=unclassified Conexibacter TaxID=2627773 RepID=UPI0027284B06|nr:MULTISPECIES: GNAT family N-acetyltransferase [unclassified Conexibacter]MDO8184243.1 GNAT family N-acetyltransferase [Conexibacter sp. CPCC 205706]MDO8197235.1 GNAT family N-acetyltransferase [Conexibacter sp. CPCC 205762]MDR9367450.1 GNAT family N-acetyltransferase [Conexibacter sp. JD483]
MSRTAFTRTTSALVALDAPLTGEWERLHDACAASPFLHPGLVTLWAQAFGAGPVTLATVRRDGELVGALPLLRQGRRLVSAADWHTVETGLLARDAAAAAALAATLARARADRIELSFLDPAGAATVRAAAQTAGYRVEEQLQIASPYLELSGDWTAFQAAQPPRRRRDRERLRRRLGDHGEVSVTFDDGADASTRATMLDTLLELEAQGWKAERGTAIAQRADTTRYYRELAGWAAARGWLRLAELRAGERVVAATLVLQAHGVRYGVKMGYDLSLRRAGPGVLLLEDVVRQAFEERLSRVEFLGGGDKYKRDLASGMRDRIGLRAFAPSVRGRVDHARTVHGPRVARQLRRTLRRREAQI